MSIPSFLFHPVALSSPCLALCRGVSILYQRGLYDAASFTKAVKYGLGLQVTADPKLTDYLNGVLAQVRHWLEKGEVKKLVLVIAHHDTEEVLERYTTHAHATLAPRLHRCYCCCCVLLTRHAAVE